MRSTPSSTCRAAADAWETRRNLFKAMNGHVIGKAVMVGMFKRPQ